MNLLGEGLEGIVYRDGNEVIKRFHDGKLEPAQIGWLQRILPGSSPWLPEPVWSFDGGLPVCRYGWFDSEPVHSISPAEALGFLHFQLRQGLVCCNIKRANFRRRTDGSLTFVDIGAWIRPMHVSYFRNMAAKLYAVSQLEWEDEKIRGHGMQFCEYDFVLSLPGFESFYSELLGQYGRLGWEGCMRNLPAEQSIALSSDEVTLLIKTCPMDAEVIGFQIPRIISVLSKPRKFTRVVVLVDMHPGPYPRAYATANLPSLLTGLEKLKLDGVIDEVWKFRKEEQPVSEINQRWFGVSAKESHTPDWVPVTPQIWAFEKVATPYVLQCDADIIIGKRDPKHDYLTEMVKACNPPDVWGIAFNIPHDPRSSCRPYDAPKGGYVPEVRCGFMNLRRLLEHRPYPNTITADRLSETWYRSVEASQKDNGFRTLRGGDPRTFYIHPPNKLKGTPGLLERAWNIAGTQALPDIQHDQWDLVGDESAWRYPPRNEDLVFLIKGRNIGKQRIQRCLASLLMQSDPNFGVVVIDDATDSITFNELSDIWSLLGDRFTFVQRLMPTGRIPNFNLAVREICQNPQSLVIILDADDALMGTGVVSKIRAEYEAGADVVWGHMFRPDKPLKLYSPSIHEIRAGWGRDVWIHLRAFRKCLFDRLTDDDLCIEGKWIEECTDYATMIPMTEMALKPVFIPEYLYYHERTTPRTQESRLRKDSIIQSILKKPSKN